MNLNRLSTNYFLTVATDWVKKGLTTEEKVNVHIEELERNSSEILLVKQALGKKSDADYDDRKLFLKWTREFNFNLDVLLTAAKSFKKRGSMENLDSLLTELKSLNALTVPEVANYLKTKEDTRQLANDIVKNLGLFYNDLEPAVKFYVNPWKLLGFTDGALRLISEYCFKQSIRSLPAMSGTIEKFCSQGALTEESIQSYMDKKVETDGHIKEVLATAGGARHVYNNERALYKTFIEEWGFTHEIVLEVAKRCTGEAFPMSAISRKLALAKEKGINDLAGIREFLGEEKGKVGMQAKSVNREASLEKQAFSAVALRKTKADDEYEKLQTKLRKDSVFAELEADISRLKFELLGASKHKIDALNMQLCEKQTALQACLLKHNLTPDKLTPQYTCKLCGDTGAQGTKNCICIQTEIDILKKERLNATFDETPKDN
jgi:hypothetical protein